MQLCKQSSGVLSISRELLGFPSSDKEYCFIPTVKHARSLSASTLLVKVSKYNKKHGYYSEA